MANQLEIPYINPIHFVPVTPGTSPLYNTKYFDDYLFEDTIFDFLEKKSFYQPFKPGDSIRLQFTSNFAPIFLDIQDCEGFSQISGNMAQVRVNKYNPGFYLYEKTFSLSSLDEGCYRIIVTPGGDTTQQQKSEWFYVSETSERTVLCEYFNNRYHEDVVFETGITFSFRFPGFIESNAPGSSDVLYKDQVLNQTQLSSKPFRNFTLWVGDGSGVPPWLIDKLNFAFSCSNVSFDGKLFAKTDADWKETTEDGDPLKGYSRLITPGINRSSRIINPGIDPSKKITLIYNIASDVFGSVDSQGGSITIPVTAKE